jgi:hypothetical protein
MTIVITAATSAVAVAIWAKSSEAQDERVQDHDVGHGEERGEPAAYLALHGRAAGGDAEEAVEPGGRRGAFLRFLGSHIG